MTGNLSDLASMKGSEFLLLPHELWLVQRDYDDLARVQQLHGEVLGEAMGQSSETYHDNAPAEAVIHEQTVLMRRVQPLQRIFRNYAFVNYPEPDSEEVEMGSTANISVNGGEAFGIQIVGYLDKAFANDDIEQTTLASPLGNALISESVGSTVEMEVEGKTRKIEVVGVDQLLVIQHYAPLLLEKALLTTLGHGDPKRRVNKPPRPPEITWK